MYFNRTLEDWIGYKIDKRTKFDLTISSGLSACCAKSEKEKPKLTSRKSSFSEHLSQKLGTPSFTIFALS